MPQDVSFHLTRDVDVPVQVRICALDLDILADDWREASALQDVVAASVPCRRGGQGDEDNEDNEDRRA